MTIFEFRQMVESSIMLSHLLYAVFFAIGMLTVAIIVAKQNIDDRPEKPKQLPPPPSAVKAPITRPAQAE